MIRALLRIGHVGSDRAVLLLGLGELLQAVDAVSFETHTAPLFEHLGTERLLVERDRGSGSAARRTRSR